MNNTFSGRSFLSSEETRSLWAMDSERILSDQLVTFSSYSAEWAEKVTREQSTAHRAFKSIIHKTNCFSNTSKLKKLLPEELLFLTMVCPIPVNSFLKTFVKILHRL
ncbi:MAG: hypothetical protein HYT63_03805 [Candidatus Yanofskybacteria bacterium]|nr:hypothetical protein [Candidatus Yanofskybacteria bacterium]